MKYTVVYRLIKKILRQHLNQRVPVSYSKIDSELKKKKLKMIFFDEYNSSIIFFYSTNNLQRRHYSVDLKYSYN